MQKVVGSSPISRLEALRALARGVGTPAVELSQVRMPVGTTGGRPPIAVELLPTG
jgi:hypothetical protein